MKFISCYSDSLQEVVNEVLKADDKMASTPRTYCYIIVLASH
jgi:hypothetical protein